MAMTRHAVAIVAALLAAVAVSSSSWAGNPIAGHVLALRWCSSCHAVDKDKVGTGVAPAFATLAHKKPTDRRWLRAWLMRPHPQMPDFSLSRADIDNIVAYLDSLVPQNGE